MTDDERDAALRFNPDAYAIARQMKKKRTTLTQADLEMLASEIVQGFKPTFENYKSKIAALENRVLELEAAAASRSKVDA